jgi:hypothetical protein
MRAALAGLLVVAAAHGAAASDFVLVCPSCQTSTAKYLGSGEMFSRWRDAVIPWYYNPANALPPFDDPQVALAAIQSAISQWEGVCGIDFRYMGLTNRKPQDFEDFITVIGWAPIGVAGLGGGVADAPWEEELRLGYCPMQEGFVAVRPIPWPDLIPDRVRIFEFIKLMTHELGHMLCLGHSDDPNSVLFADPYNGLYCVRPDDIAAAQALYGPPPILRPPQPFAVPPQDPEVIVSRQYFAVGVDWNDLVEISEVTDETPDQTLYVWAECQNLPSGEGDAYLVDPSGFVHLWWQADNEWANVASGMGLDDISIVKTLPGTWHYYWVIGGATVVAAAIQVDTTSNRNLPPDATLQSSSTTGPPPLTVTIRLTASDPEGDAVSAVWHVPGLEAWTTPVTGTIHDAFTFREVGVYRIFIEVLDDSTRYEGAGAGYRRLLPVTLRVTPPPPPPRRALSRLR